METAKKPINWSLLGSIFNGFFTLFTWVWWAFVAFLLIFYVIQKEYLAAIFIMCNMIFVIAISIYFEMRRIAQRPINIEPHIHLNTGEVAQIFYTIMKENDSFVVMEKSPMN